MIPVGVFLSAQVTFTELFIASAVIVSVAYTRGWRSSAIGTVLGALAAILLGALLHGALARVPLRALDVISSVLLLGFGAFLFREFNKAQREGEDTLEFEGRAQRASQWDQPPRWPGISVAAWGVFSEGLEILVVWLAIALHDGLPTAMTGLLIGLCAILLTALGMRRLFLKVAPKYLDLAAATVISLYGLYFLHAAVVG